MQKLITKYKYLLAITAFLMSGPVFAGRPDKAGTAGASELLIPVGAASIALSGANISTVAGIDACYWNPAGLASMNSDYGLIFSRMNYLADIDIDYAAIAVKFQPVGIIALHLKTVEVGDIPITTEESPDGTGETTSPQFITVGATLSKNITDRIAVGLSGNFIYERMALVSASSVGFNFGVQYRGIGGIDGLSVGVAIKNIGPAIRFDGSGLFREVQIKDASGKNSILKIQAASSELPSNIEVGLGYRLTLTSFGALVLSTSFQSNNYSSDVYNFGVNFDYQEHLFFRSGMSLTSEAGRSEDIFGNTFGIGVKDQFLGYRFQIDYAYRIVRFFDGNHVFSLALGF